MMIALPTSKPIRQYTIAHPPETLRVNNKFSVAFFGARRAGLVLKKEYAHAKALVENITSHKNDEMKWPTLSQPLVLFVHWYSHKTRIIDDKAYLKMDNDAIGKCVKDALQGDKKDFPTGNVIVDDGVIVEETYRGFLIPSNEEGRIEIYLWPLDIKT